MRVRRLDRRENTLHRRKLSVERLHVTLEGRYLNRIVVDDRFNRIDPALDIGDCFCQRLLDRLHPDARKQSHISRPRLCAASCRRFLGWRGLIARPGVKTPRLIARTQRCLVVRDRMSMAFEVISLSRTESATSIDAAIVIPTPDELCSQIGDLEVVVCIRSKDGADDLKQIGVLGTQKRSAVALQPSRRGRHGPEECDGSDRNTIRRVGTAGVDGERVGCRIDIEVDVRSGLQVDVARHQGSIHEDTVGLLIDAGRYRIHIGTELSCVGLECGNVRIMLCRF
ncbi:hypothetical protein D3C76_962290 [compost metagenome]